MKKAVLISFIITTLFCVDIFSQNLLDKNSSIINSYFLVDAIPFQIEFKNSNSLPYEADVIVNQQGNYNEAYLQTNKNSKVQVNQIGDSNDFELYSYYNSNPSNFQSTQRGDNNSIQMYGINELSNRIEINQTTNNQTLIVINH